MSLFTKTKKARENKKGFTLVELIVVLVILAILAAILVPALLGWIDEAKKKQYVLEARSVYMAMQAIADEKYAAENINTSPISAAIYCAGSSASGIPSTDMGARIKELADVEVTKITSVTAADNSVEATADAATLHKRYTIAGIEITFTSQDGHSIEATLAGGTWEITDNGVLSTP